ncbi:ribosomal protein S18-alanine N-acetyltransferase [Phorcysia thermohydrogeniphila]|uniref:[Ribosomal protein bS18]-alanine N-acetyltransferase n=1 Tax=Phorcysia thermohydrogeniphila TaxID=936138 RepID=A0A4R1G7D5_9BACT|nr:ribosomal protein S18-alanine N-acetyltransferase [Phorcysia thermohydrogeniphila]TCK03448.1 [SSU ribosomal protein S18P]-alanine acetyltransferase [Phorcysia thermohydrogeniphila]
MQNLLVREFREEDLPDILKIERESFSNAWSKKSFLKEAVLPFSRFIVAESSGRVVGYLIAWVVGKTCDVNRIAVLPAFRRRGVGKELLKKLLDILREEGVEEVFLEVRKSNIPAIKLYESFGFKRVGVRKEYYSGEDALLLLKTF